MKCRHCDTEMEGYWSGRKPYGREEGLYYVYHCPKCNYQTT
jgi:hypothetical protein